MVDINLEITKTFNQHRDAILAGQYALLMSTSFNAIDVHEEDENIIISLGLSDEIRAQLPLTHQHIDIFILDAHCRLKPHYHEFATAHVTIIEGEGTARIEDHPIPFKEQSKFVFPAGNVHSVEAGAQPVVLISAQNNPIAKPDGSFDYILV